MIHKVKYGLMEVVLASSLTSERAPDLTFTSGFGKEFAVFFAPLSTTEGTAMKAAYYDYYTPFEAEYSDKEVEAMLRREKADDRV